MKSQVIYNSGDPTSGSIKIVFESTPKSNFRRNFLKGISSGLIAISMLGFWGIYGPVITQEVSYQTGNSKFVEINLAEIAQANETEKVQKEAQQYGVNSYYSVVIPKIGASEDIVVNVDANDKAEYEEALQKGIAHAKGTYFPGQNNKIFLFAHSTNSALNVAKYNATFYLLNKLVPEDEILVFFSDKKYAYQVSETHIVDPDDTSWLKETDEETLVLQTCYPPGTTWKRLIVVAKPIS